MKELIDSWQERADWNVLEAPRPKIESTRDYTPSPVITELRESRIIFEHPITSETKVCLIGDGQGMDTEQILQMGVKPENIHSINFEQSEVDQANEEILKDAGVKMKQGDATDLESLQRAGVEEQSQGVVTLMHVLEVPNMRGDNERRLVENIAKILRPGGELIVSQYSHRFSRDERELQRQIGIEEITTKTLQTQFGDNWRVEFEKAYGIPWEDGMRYGEISNIRTPEQLRKMFESLFDIKFEETETEFILRMKKKP